MYVTARKGSKIALCDNCLTRKQKEQVRCPVYQIDLYCSLGKAVHEKFHKEVPLLRYDGDSASNK